MTPREADKAVPGGSLADGHRQEQSVAHSLHRALPLLTPAPSPDLEQLVIIGHSAGQQ